MHVPRFGLAPVSPQETNVIITLHQEKGGVFSVKALISTNQHAVSRVLPDIVEIWRDLPRAQACRLAERMSGQKFESDSRCRAIHHFRRSAQCILAGD